MKRIKMVKGQSTKEVEAQWQKELEKLGWRLECTQDEDMSDLWAEAKELGLNLHHKTGKEKLKEAIEKAKAE